MAIIRTQLVGSERRIITKVVNGQRRVSCSCCEEPECCMYPADQLGAGYTIDDLPDLLVTQFVGEQFVKRVSPLTYTVGGESFTAYYGGQEFAIGIKASNPINWIQQVDFGFGNSQECLISQLIQDGPADWVYDNFADTYTVTTNQATGVVTRRSLCSWTGIDSLGCDLELLYETLLVPPRSGTRFKWTVDFAEGGLTPCAERAIAVKAPHQNTPVGSYDAGVSVS
jgi:hypothetical protein